MKCGAMLKNVKGSTDPAETVVLTEAQKLELKLNIQKLQRTIGFLTLCISIMFFLSILFFVPL